jgi:hypothetical protein
VDVPYVQIAHILGQVGQLVSIVNNMSRKRKNKKDNYCVLCGEDHNTNVVRLIKNGFKLRYIGRESNAKNKKTNT